MDDVKKQIKPTDAELKAFYDKNKQEYANSIPEKRKSRYILIDRAKWPIKLRSLRRSCSSITASIRMNFAFLKQLRFAIS